MGRKPDHLRVYHDQHRAAPFQRTAVIRPVRCAVAGGQQACHTAILTQWIRKMNRARAEFCNNASWNDHRHRLRRLNPQRQAA